MSTRPLVAEFIGTFALVLIGAGTVVVSDGDLVAYALAFGLVLMVFVYAFGHISGTHVNPAVTIGLWLNKEIETGKAVGYIVVQFLGALVAALTMAAVFGESTSLGQTTLASGVSVWQGLVVEIILTFFLVNTIYHTAVGGKAGLAAGAAIGLTLMFAELFGGPLTGGSLNPARTLGPAIVSGTYDDIWIYFVGPILGGILAALLYRFLRAPAAE